MEGTTLLCRLLVLLWSHQLALALTSTFTPTDDTFVQGDSEVDQSAQKEFMVKQKKPFITRLSLIRYSFLQFNVSSLPVDAVVSSATLRLTLKGGQSGAKVRLCPAATFEESQVTWSHYPAYVYEDSLGDVDFPTSGNTMEWDIKDYIKEQVQLGNTTLAFALDASPVVARWVTFRSKEHEDTNYWPALIIETEDATALPTKPPTAAPTERPMAQPTPHPTGTPTLFPTTPPTLSPATGPTSLPTIFPLTSRPTRRPTESPTSLPTQEPSNFPTPSPTLPPTTTPTKSPPTRKPSTSPTAQLTEMPTKPPITFDTICQKCVRNGCFAAVTPENEGKCKKFECITMVSCPGYKLVSSQGDEGKPQATQRPTAPPTPISTSPSAVTFPAVPSPNPDISNSTSPPSTLVRRRLETGKVCSDDLECVSGTCRNGACMASPDCYPVKHKYGTPFDSNTINIVFVGSAFDATMHEAWRAQVNATYRYFQRFNMFSAEIDELNIFLVDPPTLSKSFCSLGCANIDRLLCCSISKAHSLSGKCFPAGTNNLQTVVIHNDKNYGGAGFPAENVATMTTHPRGAEVAVHELGHSLFELGDEYAYNGGGGDRDVFPNCDSTSSCEKWSDLIGKEEALAGYGPVKCILGCKDNKQYIGELSFMGDLSEPVGAVNERFTCCTYLALTKSMPSYCNVFDFSPNYLFAYCKSNDFQHYGASNYDPRPALHVPGNEGRYDDAKYVFVTHPVLVKIKLKSNGQVKVEGKPISLPAGMYQKTQVKGDFSSYKDAAKQGMDSLVKVRVMYQPGKDLLFFSQNTTVEIPISPFSSRTPQKNMPKSISQKSDIIEVVIDTRGRRIKRVKAKQTVSMKQ